MLRKIDRAGVNVSVVALAFLAVSAPLRDARAQCGVDLYAANATVGGGLGYSSMVMSGEADFIVRSRAELVSAVSNAQPGDVIYIPNNAAIDMAPAGVHWSNWTIKITKPDITIASGRGLGGATGGKLYVQASDLRPTDPPPGLKPGFPPLFSVEAPGVRFTGLEVYGDDYAVVASPRFNPSADPRYDPPILAAIHVKAQGTVEVDNCEMHGFSHSPVFAINTVADIHHNHLHHNRRNGLGYGVVLDENADVTVESNIFSHNRHDVAATGHPLATYAARYNLVIGQGIGHSFDVHGEGESAGEWTGWAGENLIVEFNTFLDQAKTGVRVRGIPFGFAFVNNNWFPHRNLVGEAVDQQQKAAPSVWRESTITGTTPNDPRPPLPPGVTPSHGLDRMRLRNNCVAQSGWFRYDEKYEGLYPLARSTATDVALVDFDGNGKADVFRAEGGKWFVSYDGTTNWTEISTQPYTLSQLRFGHFVGDSRTDVFLSENGFWFAWNIQTGQWKQLAKSSLGVASLAFGNFVGDSRTDVFRTDGSKWYVSNGAVDTFVAINDSGLPLSSLAFGNFVGDARTDVMTTTGSEWRVSVSGTTLWQHLAWSNARLPEILFGDFVGDSRTDALTANTVDTAEGKSTAWYVSDGSAAATPTLYANFAHGNYPASVLKAADFTGDGTAEVFFAGNP